MFLVALAFICISGILTLIALFERKPDSKPFMAGGVFAALAIASAILALSAKTPI